ALLFLLQHGHHLVKNGVSLLERLALRGHVAVVEAVVRHAELFHELEGDADALDRHLDRVGAVLPGADGAARAERVGPRAAESMPVAHREAQVLPHGVALNLFVGVVVAEAERVGRIGAFVADAGHVEKRHSSPANGWMSTVGRRLVPARHYNTGEWATSK